MVYFSETKGIVLVREVKTIQPSIKIIARVTGWRVILLSNPPSKISLKKKTNITPKSKGSVGKVKAAYSLNSTVRENGVKNRMK